VSFFGNYLGKTVTKAGATFSPPAVISRSLIRPENEKSDVKLKFFGLREIFGFESLGFESRQLNGLEVEC